MQECLCYALQHSMELGDTEDHKKAYCSELLEDPFASRVAPAALQAASTAAADSAAKVIVGAASQIATRGQHAHIDTHGHRWF